MSNIKKATFAGGCFWCMVKPFDKLEGVINVVSGYTGGDVENPIYEEVITQTTGHYEAVEITYDEDKTGFDELVDVFFRSIDPTDPGGQFHDRGNSYKTVVFYHDENQKAIVEDYIDKLNKSGRFNKPVATLVKPAAVFYPAEEYHQNYYRKNSLSYKMYYNASGRKEFIEKNWDKNLYKRDELKTKLTPLQ